MHKYVSNRGVCDEDGCRGDRSDGGCLQPCWTARFTSDMDCGGPEGVSTRIHIERVGEEGRGCVWGVSSLNE